MITDTQRADRVKGIGSSDAPAILEVCPFRSPWEIWAEKVGLIPPFEGNHATWIGTVLEPALRKAAAEIIGEKVVAVPGTMVAANGVMRANLDGMVGKAQKGRPLVEIKVTSMAERWGKDGTDEIPDSVLAQVHHQMVCAESFEAHVVALINDWTLEIRHYHIARDPDVAALVERECVRFWREHVEPHVQPEITKPGRNMNELLGKIQRNAGSVVQIPDELILAYLAAQEAEKAAEEAKALARAKLLAAIGDAAVGEAKVGRAKAIYVKQKRLDTKLFTKSYPDLVAAFTKETGYSRLEVKANADAQDE